MAEVPNFFSSPDIFRRPTMDAFNLHWLSQQDIPLSATVTFLVSVSFVLLVFKFAVLSRNEESPVSFRVPLPEQCDRDWKGPILDEPAIKVSHGHCLDESYELINARHTARPRSNATVQPMDVFSAASIIQPLMALTEQLPEQKRRRRHG